MSFGEHLEEEIGYLYDGGLVGFYCCAYESIQTKRLPTSILSERTEQPSLLPQLYIEPDTIKAHKMRRLIEAKSSFRAVELIENVFLSCLHNKEIFMLRFLLRSLREGKAILNKLGDEEVAMMLKAEKFLLGEAHHLTGFIRFSDYNGMLVSTITPKNFVLPYITDHFVNRFPREDFLIFDKSHKAALIYQSGKKKIISVDHIDTDVASEVEENYRALWKRFYHTIAIENRRNSRLRMNNMPKRFWENMTEMKELL